MKIFLLPLILSSFSCVAQSSIGIGLAGNLLNVDFINSAGISNKNLKGLPGAGAFLLFERDLSTARQQERFQKVVSLTFGFRSSAFKNNSSTVLTEWRVSFLETSAMFKLIKKTEGTIAPIFQAGVMHNYLMSGSQGRGFEQYDLTGSLKRNGISASIGGGIVYKISTENMTGITMSYMRGLNNIERDVNQVARFHAWQLSTFITLGTASQRNKK